ncbi:hypothetical protein DFJ73DRAFT_811112, partial [Zopfochytrium polystomum]
VAERLRLAMRAVVAHAENARPDASRLASVDAALDYLRTNIPEAVNPIFPAGKALKLAALLLLAVNAVAGDLAYTWVLAETLDHSEDLPSLPDEATKWYRVGAKQDHPDCQLAYAKKIIEGVTTPRDDYKAVAWLTAACRSADTHAQDVAASVALATLLLSSPLVPATLSDVLNLLIRSREKAGFAGFLFGGQGLAKIWEEMANSSEPDPDAMFEMGNVFALAEDVPADYPTAMYWYIESVQAGSWKGLAGLSDLLQNTPAQAQQMLPFSLFDNETKQKIAQLAEEAEDSASLPPLDGINLPKLARPQKPLPDWRPRISEKWFVGREKLAEIEAAVSAFARPSSVPATPTTPVHPSVSDEDEKKEAKAKIIQLLREKEHGIAKARYERTRDTAHLVEYAKLVPESAEKRALLQKAADSGSSDAMFILSEVLKSENVALSVYLLTQAAEQDHPAACTKLGMLHEKGLDGISLDAQAANSLYTRAKDYPEALYRRANLLQSGVITTPYFDEFETILKRAICFGHLRACYSYGAHLARSTSSNSPPSSATTLTHVASTPRIPSTLDAWRFVERALDFELTDIPEARDFRTMMDATFKTILAAHGREIILSARAGDLQSQMALGYVLKSLGVQGMAAVVFFGNVGGDGSGDPDAPYEVARAFHIGIGDVKRHLFKAAAWYYEAARINRGGKPSAAKTLALVALRDLFEAGSDDVSNNGVGHAFPKDANGAALYGALALKAFDGVDVEVPVPVLPSFDVLQFLAAEKADQIRTNVTMGILQVGEIEALLQSFPEGRASLGRKATGGGGFNKAEEVGDGLAGMEVKEGWVGQEWDEVALTTTVGVKPVNDREVRLEKSAAVCCTVM